MAHVVQGDRPRKNGVKFYRTQFRFRWTRNLKPNFWLKFEVCIDLKWLVLRLAVLVLVAW